MFKKIGVIGGMGPMASQLFYKMVTEMTEAERDQDHVPMVILSDTEMPDRTASILAGETEEIAARLLADGRRLESLDCQAIAITCNTSHYFVDMIAGDLKIPIIHMIQETVKEIAGVRGAFSRRRIAVLATDGTIKTGLYQKELERAGLEPFVPGQECQQLVMHEIYDCIKAGRSYDPDAWRLIHEELLKADCHRAILACTELSVISWDNGFEAIYGNFYVDAMTVLAQRAIEFSGAQPRGDI